VVNAPHCAPELSSLQLGKREGKMTNWQQGMSGGCQCGAVRYRFTGKPGGASICHCRMCQKAFGSWGAALVSLKAAEFVWTRGKPSEYRSSPPVARGFCAQCGTPLYMRDDGDENYEMAIGTLDDPDRTPPTKQVGVESELKWFRSLAALPRQETGDYNSPEKLARYRSRQHPDHDTEAWKPDF
jgi:hypothetical protein